MTAARWRSLAFTAPVICLAVLLVLLGQHWPSGLKWLIVAVSAVLLCLNLGLLVKVRRRGNRD